jgi:hypothetical protein
MFKAGKGCAPRLEPGGWPPESEGTVYKAM